MVSPVSIATATQSAQRSALISALTLVPTGPDGVPGHLHQLHVTQPDVARPVLVTDVTLITVKDQLNAARTLSIQRNHVFKSPIFSRANSAVIISSQTVVSDTLINSVVHATHQRNVTSKSPLNHTHSHSATNPRSGHHGPMPELDAKMVLDSFNDVSSKKEHSRTVLLFGLLLMSKLEIFQCQLNGLNIKLLPTHVTLLP